LCIRLVYSYLRSMRRREFITLVGGTIVCPLTALTAYAQQTPKLPIIGYLAAPGRGSGTGKKLCESIHRRVKLGRYFYRKLFYLPRTRGSRRPSALASSRTLLAADDPFFPLRERCHPCGDGNNFGDFFDFHGAQYSTGGADRMRSHFL
jgi:hypothetical protein